MGHTYVNKCVRVCVCVSFVPRAMVILYVSPFSLSLPRSTSRVERRTKRSTKRIARRTKKAAKEPNALYYLRIHIGRRRREQQHTHSIRVYKKKNERIQRTTTHQQQRTHAQLSLPTSRRCVYAYKRRARMYTQHSRRPTVSPEPSRGEPNGRRRTTNEYYKHTHARDEEKERRRYVHTNNLLTRSDIRRFIARGTNARFVIGSRLSPSLTISCHENVFGIALPRSCFACNVVPAWALGVHWANVRPFPIAHNAATIPTTTNSTHYYHYTTVNSANDAGLFGYCRYGWARGWRDSCICQDDSSLKGNIGAIAVYAVLSLEFVH